METKLMLKILVCLCFVSGLNAQTSFYKLFSGNGYDRAEGVCQLEDSSFLITGTSSSFDEAPSQAFLLHIDSAGNYLWSRAYGGSESEEGKRVMAVENYGFYVAGTSSSGSSGDFDNYLFFTDPDGNPVWETFTDNGGWERVHDAVLMPDTTIITVGETDNGSEGNTDIYLCRYSKTGALLWDFQFGSDSSDIAYAAEPYNDTSFLIAGSYFVADSLQNKAYLARFHINGTLIWEETYGSNGDYWLRDISVASETRIKLVGESIKTGYHDYDSYNILAGMDGTLLGSDENHVDQDTRYTACVQFEPGADGRHFVAAQVINPNTPTYPEGEDVVILRSDGYFNWDGYGLSYSGIGQDQVNHMIHTSDGFAIAVGYATTYGPGGNSITVIKIGDENTFPYFSTSPEIEDIVSINEEAAITGLIVYPNPVKDILNVVLDDACEMMLSDLTGHVISRQQTTGGMNQIPVSDLPSGIYLLRIRTEEAEATVRIIHN